MTTYCIDPNESWLAVYKLSTRALSTDNVIFSHITADLSDSATSISITSGEGSLFTGGMVATIEQLNSEGKATKREVVYISAISTDTLTITRGFDKCVQDDTASPKVLGDTPQSFTTGAKISVYTSKSILNGIQNRLENVNKPCNTEVYDESIEMSNCVLNNCDDWRDKLLQTKACCCYNDKGFGSGCDGDCTMSGNIFLCASKEYEFENLTIEEGACVRFEGQGVPTIRVKRKFCNMGTIDLRGGTFVGCCSSNDPYTNTSIGNNADSTAYNSMCFGCGGSGSGGCAGGNATATCGGNGGDAQNGCARNPATCADGFNGGNGAQGASCARNGRSCGSGGGGGGVCTGNGGDGGTGHGGSTSYDYAMDGGQGGNGGNGGIRGKGGKGGDGAIGYAGGQGGNGGNGYIGGDGGDHPSGRDCMAWGCAGTGGKGIIQGGKGGGSFGALGVKGGQGGDAINNMYGFRLYACEIFNNVICGKGGVGGEGGRNTMASSYTSGGGNGGNGANGGKIFIGYFRDIVEGCVDVSGGNGGAGGRASGSCNYGCPGTSGTDGCSVICKIM